MFSFSRRKCTTTVYQYIQRIYSRIQSHVLDFQKAQHTSTSKGSRHSSTSSYHIPVPGTRSSFTYLPHLELPTRVSSAVPFAAELCLITSYCCTSTAIEWPWTRKHPRGCRGDGTSHQTRCRSRFLAFCRACRLVTVVFANVSSLARFSNIGHRVSSLFYTSRPVSAVSKRSVLLLAYNDICLFSLGMMLEYQPPSQRLPAAWQTLFAYIRWTRHPTLPCCCSCFLVVSAKRPS